MLRNSTTIRLQVLQRWLLQDPHTPSLGQLSVSSNNVRLRTPFFHCPVATASLGEQLLRHDFLEIFQVDFVFSFGSRSLDHLVHFVALKSFPKLLCNPLQI